MKSLSILILLFASNIAYCTTYEIPRSKVDVRIVELRGHEYVVGSIVGDFSTFSYSSGGASGGNGSAISLVHFEGCPCRNGKNLIVYTNNVNTVVITNISNDVKAENDILHRRVNNLITLVGQLKNERNNLASELGKSLISRRLAPTD